MKKIVGVILVLIAFIVVVAENAHAKSRTKAEREAIEGTVLWNHKFPGAILYAEMTSGGRLHIMARDVNKKKSSKSRYIMDYSGNILWQGNAAESVFLGDALNPVVLMIEGNGFVMRALGAGGSSKWSYPMPGIPASTLMDDTTSAMIMVVMPYEWGADTGKAYSANLVAVDLNTGKAKWTTPVGTIKGGLSDFGGEMGVANGSIYWAAGGRAFRADIKTGKLFWNADIETPENANTLWTFSAGSAAALKGGNVMFFNDASGLKWKHSFKGVDSPDGIAISYSGVVTSIGGKKNLTVAALGLDDGNVIWSKSLKHNSKKMGPPPAGIATSGNVVAVAANRKIIGLDIASGSEVYSVKLKKSEFLMMDSMRDFGDHFVLVGFEGASAYNTATGSILWEKHGYVDPVSEIRAAKAAVWAVAMGALKSDTSPQAKEAWKKHSEGSMSFTQAAQTASFYNSLHSAQEAEKTRQSAEAVSKLGEIELMVVNRSLGPDYAEFYDPKGMSLFGIQDVQQLDGVIMDLRSGSVRNAGTKKARAGCVGQILIDPIHGKMLQVYRQMGLGCTHEMEMEMYPFE